MHVNVRVVIFFSLSFCFFGPCHCFSSSSLKSSLYHVYLLVLVFALSCAVVLALIFVSYYLQFPLSLFIYIEWLQRPCPCLSPRICFCPCPCLPSLNDYSVLSIVFVAVAFLSLFILFDQWQRPCPCPWFCPVFAIVPLLLLILFSLSLSFSLWFFLSSLFIFFGRDDSVIVLVFHCFNWRVVFLSSLDGDNVLVLEEYWIVQVSVQELRGPG